MWMEATDQPAEENLAVALQRISIGTALEGTRRVQRWTGFWEQNFLTNAHRVVMIVELYFGDNHKICGGGSDEIGLFTCTGECQGTQVHFVKQYIGKHQVHYDGELNNDTIDGVWTIAGGRGGRGNFQLEHQSCNSAPKGREARCLQVGEMQTWTGYYKLGGSRGNMSGEILFTDAHNIYGNGVDAVGRFTWLGCYQQGSQTVLVSMTKQYEKQHAVYYMGAVGHSHSVGQEEPKMVMEGSWVLATNLAHGAYLLKPEVNSRAPFFVVNGAIRRF